MRTMLVAASGILATTAISSVIAESQEKQKMFTAEDIKWSPGPPSLPPGAEAALLYGDATKEGLFALNFNANETLLCSSGTKRPAPA